MKKYNSMYNRWSDADDIKLLEMLEEGASSAQVAKALGRTRAAVWGRKSKLGLEGRFRRSIGVKDPASVLKKRRTSNVSSVEAHPVETFDTNLTLTRAAELAKSLGISVSVITFNP